MMGSAARLGLSTAAAWAVLAVFAARSGTAQPAVPEGWTCQFCPFESGLSSQWSLGSGFVSDDSGKFGDYTGLGEHEFYAIAGGELRYWGDSGSYWELLVDDLGLDSRSLALDGGQPGIYRVRAGYDEIPKYSFDGALTPFMGVGSSSLSLPAGWVEAGSTAGLTALNQSLHRFDVVRQRKTLGLGLDWLASANFDYRADYRREERTGQQLMAGSFATLSAWLPAPVDYVTDELELGMSRTWARGTIDVTYFGSNFSNRATALEWQNPFTPLAAGADFGRLGLAPDNSAHQLLIAGHYRVSSGTHVSASFASGELEQDDVFSAFTVNPNIASPNLPRTSLAGNVETSRLALDVVSQPFNRLRLAARYHRDERDNKTAQAVYDYVLTDLAPAGARINIPYGFDRSSTSLSADYRLPFGLRLKAGVDRDVHERTFQARSSSEEDSIWAELGVRSFDWVQATIGVADRSRVGSDYRSVDLGAGQQNPLLRQYHIADRDQRIAELDVTLVPHERVNLLLRAERTRDEYPGAQLGLTQGISRYLSFDASVELSTDLNAYAAWGREDVEFDQAASQRFGTPDWYAMTEDTTNTRSLGLTKSALDERMRLQLEYSASRSRGVTQMRVGVPASEFPDFTTSLNALSLRVDYDISESLAIRIAYRNERYSSADWQIDGLRLTTLANILTFGAQSPAYNIDWLTVSFTYTPARN
jgi:MtrB/PioB family decaheme-associated outer membrane protein